VNTWLPILSVDPDIALDFSLNRLDRSLFCNRISRLVLNVFNAFNGFASATFAIFVYFYSTSSVTGKNVTGIL
jgi:hypothetical protein